MLSVKILQQDSKSVLGLHQRFAERWANTPDSDLHDPILIKHFFIVPLHCSWAIKTSSRQRKLDAQAEILCGGRITAARQERCVGLTVIIETHGKEFAEGIIGRETQFQSIVAAAGTAYH